MKASELRLGNYIFQQMEMEDGKYLPVKVVEISEDRILFLTEKQQFFLGIRPFSSIIKQAIPIHLTEDWLLKFGFTLNRNRMQISENFYFENNKLWVGLPDGQFRRYIQISSDRWQYVHQLQNLYFALIGEELK